MVYTTEKGSMVTSTTLKYCNKRVIYSLYISINFHSLKHSRATILLENGANIKDVQTRLGHTRIATTMDTYAHVTKNELKYSKCI